jgi:hypothetical protein
MKKINSQQVLKSFDLDYSLSFLSGKGKEKLSSPQTLFKNATLGIEKYELLHLIYSKGYGKVYEDIADSVKDRYFNKMYKYISEIKLEEIESIKEIIPSLDEKVVKSSLNKLILYFQHLEEYEKCAVIKKILDLVKK